MGAGRREGSRQRSPPGELTMCADSCGIAAGWRFRGTDAGNRADQMPRHAPGASSERRREGRGNGEERSREEERNAVTAAVAAR